MSVVGEFPGMASHRRTIRAPINPMDKCTIVSIYPKDIGPEKKHTIQPGTFYIKSGTYEVPSITIIGPSSWWRDIDEQQPLLEITNSSIQVADSIVNDYCNGLLGFDSDKKPGLFYLTGVITLVDLKTKHKAELDKARDGQKRWYESLIMMADSSWARSNGNPLTVSDDMRLAARELNLEKDWMQNQKAYDMIRCVACGALRNENYPVCGSCHAVIDKKKAEELGLIFAK